jgi:hypothetical protein
MDEEAPKTKAAHGTNSYYYWHGHEKERAKVGDVAPKPSPVLVKTEAAVASPLLSAVNISKYSWADGKSVVSVYIDFDDISEEQLQVQFTERQLRVAIRPPHTAVVHSLFLRLAEGIVPEKSTYRLKRNQVVIKLSKAEEATWYDLVDSKGAAEADE